MESNAPEMGTAPQGETPTPEPAETAATIPPASETPAPETPNESELEQLRKQVKALNAENAKRRKDAEVAEAARLAEQGKYKELYEKAQAEIKAAQEAAAQAERERMIDRIAAQHKLPEALRDRLRGETAEDLEKDAAELAKLVVPAAPEKAPPPRTDAEQRGSLKPGDNAPEQEARVRALYGIR